MSKSNGTKRIDVRVEQFLAIRKRMEELKEEHKAQLLPFQAVQQKLIGEMQAFLDETGQEMARTPMGTAYTYVRHTAVCTDPDALIDFVREHDAYELLDRKANATACREYADEHQGAYPPGVKINSVRTVGVRTS